MGLLNYSRGRGDGDDLVSLRRRMRLWRGFALFLFAFFSVALVVIYLAIPVRGSATDWTWIFHW